MCDPGKTGLESLSFVAYRQVVTGHAGRVIPTYSRKSITTQMELLNKRVHGQTPRRTMNPFGEGDPLERTVGDGAATSLCKKPCIRFQSFALRA